MITTENLFDLRRSINGLEIEIREIGVEFNPLKSKLMMNHDDLQRIEVEFIETYGSTTHNRFVTFPDNINKEIKK